MFRELGNLGSLINQARQMQGKLAGVGDELRSRRATGVAGGGLVEIEVNGLEEVLACRIDQGLLAQGDRELLEDLVCAAANQAIAKAKQLHTEAMQSVVGGFSVPGFDEAITRLTQGAEPTGESTRGSHDDHGE